MIFDSFQDQHAKAVAKERVAERLALARGYNLIRHGIDSPSPNAGESMNGRLRPHRDRNEAVVELRDTKDTIRAPRKFKLDFGVFSRFAGRLSTRSEPELRVLFRTLLRPGRSSVEFRQWLRLLDVLQLRVTHRNGSAAGSDSRRLEDSLGFTWRRHDPARPAPRTRSVRHVAGKYALLYCVLEYAFLAAVYLNVFALFYYAKTSSNGAGSAAAQRGVDIACRVCTAVLVAEMAFRGVFGGLSAVDLLRTFPFDVGVTAIAAISELLFFGRWLAVARATRILRVASTSPRLCRLLRSIWGCVQTVMWLFVLLLVIFYMFVAVGMELFSSKATGKPPYSNLESFDGFWHAMLSLFQISTTNNWNDVMFTVLPSTRIAYSLFFLVFYFLVCMVVLNVVTTLIIQGFADNQEMVEKQTWLVETRDGAFLVEYVEPWQNQFVRGALTNSRSTRSLHQPSATPWEDRSRSPSLDSRGSFLAMLDAAVSGRRSDSDSDSPGLSPRGSPSFHWSVSPPRPSSVRERKTLQNSE